MPGSNRSVVADAKDLKPFMVRDLRCTVLGPSSPLFVIAPVGAAGHGDVTGRVRQSPGTCGAESRASAL